MTLEIDLTGPESRYWLADREPTRFTNLGEPLSDDVVQRGMKIRIKQAIEELLETEEENFVDERLRGEFTANTRARLASEVLVYVEGELDLVQLYENVLEEIAEDEDLIGRDLLNEALERTGRLLLSEQIPVEILNQLEMQIVNRYQGLVSRMIDGLEESTREATTDMSYSYDLSHERVRIEQTG